MISSLHKSVGVQGEKVGVQEETVSIIRGNSPSKSISFFLLVPPYFFNFNNTLLSMVL